MTDTFFTIPVVRGIRTNPASGGSTAIDVEAYDSGMIFINHFTTATTYTLPVVAEGKGKVFWFMNAQTTGTLVITSPTAIMVCNDNLTATTNTTDAVCGLWAMVVGDGTNYFCFEGGQTTAQWTAA